MHKTRFRLLWVCCTQFFPTLSSLWRTFLPLNMDAVMAWITVLDVPLYHLLSNILQCMLLSYYSKESCHYGFISMGSHAVSVVSNRPIHRLFARERQISGWQTA